MTAETLARRAVSSEKDAVISVDDLCVRFGGGLFSGPAVHALRNVSFSVGRNRTLAIVGESGSGKSTLGACIAGIQPPTTGTVQIDGRNVTPSVFRADPSLRRRVQLIFQDPAAALNPRQKVGSILAEPLLVHGLAARADVPTKVADLLRAVGLGPGIVDRYPHAFSGGQKQRLVIARALALEPDMLVCDEAVSALDVSVQAQIVNLLKDLQETRGITCLFISHDMAVVRHIADEIIVLKQGELIESGAAEDVIANPTSSYTRKLIDSVPRGISHLRGTSS